MINCVRLLTDNIGGASGKPSANLRNIWMCWRKRAISRAAGRLGSRLIWSQPDFPALPSNKASIRAISATSSPR